MATFIINKGYDESRTVVADKYKFEDGYVNFYDVEGQVLTITSNQIHEIERQA